jgi:hypothetical protein
MAVMLVHRGPSLTRERCEQVVALLTGGKPRLESLSDWPVEGILSHSAGEGPDGFMVVDVWESEEAVGRFGETLGPLLQEAGVQEPPQVFPAHTVVKS